MNNWIMSIGIPIKAMSKKQFVNNLALIWNKGLSPSNIRSGFEFVGVFPFNREKYDQSIFDPQLVQKYERWLVLGKPEIMPPEVDELENVPVNAAAMEQSKNNTEEYAQPPPPLDKEGKPRKGRWVWIDESVEGSDIQTLDTLADSSQPGPSRAVQVPSIIQPESSRQVPVFSTQAGPSGVQTASPTTQCVGPSQLSPSSFLNIISGWFGQTPTTGQGKRKKRVNMSAAIITQEEVHEELESRESPTTSKDPKIQKRNGKTIRKYVSISDDDTDDNESSLHSSDLTDESDSDIDISDLSTRLEDIRELLNDSNWKENAKGKLFAVHFDKPRKFYIGTLHDIFYKNGIVTRASFEFLDFHGGTRFVKKKTLLEVVPAYNIFYGPILGNPVKGNATEFTPDIFN
jgi:hypothetical protein